ncbi:hypothetical protein H9L17_00685 [Thermomonas brevis]|uniref:Uncharacterized protein n=1 Tax=Thermomonas brevis TaxID=215691 RepID=A0A7G9QTS1_9GAMM|nr:hypothetical protein [Thermomonas brevis]QNN46746.1 hypothetical protein H9L17_00685 [Thermomonas brevis]
MSDIPQSWKHKLKPMEGPRWPLRCRHVFAIEDVLRLQAGLWPRDMDDRWAIWLDGDVLRCWRSWTGTCIYEARLTPHADGSATALMLDVLDEPETYARATTEEAELQRFEGVLSLIRQLRSEAESIVHLPVD